MAEYIDREIAINLFYTVDPENDGTDGITEIRKTANYSSEEIESMLSDLPPTDVAPVRHGYWRKVVGTRYCGISKDGNPIYRESYSYCCSNCDRGTIIKERYCPRCGAKMDGGNCDD